MYLLDRGLVEISPRMRLLEIGTKLRHDAQIADCARLQLIIANSLRRLDCLHEFSEEKVMYADGDELRHHTPHTLLVRLA